LASKKRIAAGPLLSIIGLPFSSKEKLLVCISVIVIVGGVATTGEHEDKPNNAIIKVDKKNNCLKFKRLGLVT